LHYDDEARALARERKQAERQMVQDAEDRIKAEQALEVVAIARRAEDEDAVFLANRRAELDADIRRATEQRLIAEHEAATAASARHAAEARADSEGNRKEAALAELAQIAPHAIEQKTVTTVAGISRTRAMCGLALALSIGLLFGTEFGFRLKQFASPYLGLSTNDKIELRLDDRLGKLPTLPPRQLSDSSPK
jgi:hypothetical protein